MKVGKANERVYYRIRVYVAYDAAFRVVEFQPFNRSYSQLADFNSSCIKTQNCESGAAAFLTVLRPFLCRGIGVRVRVRGWVGSTTSVP